MSLVHALPARAAACRRALAGIPGVEPRGLGGFTLALLDGRLADLRFHVDGGWVELTAGLPTELASVDPWDALAAAATVEGLAKLALKPGACALDVRADIALEGLIDPAPRLAAACSDMRSLAAALAGSPGTHDRSAARDAAVDPSAGCAGRADLCELISEAGWSYVERDPERLAVDLAIPDRFQQAFITPSACGGTLARATLVVSSAPTLASRRAIGVLLLTVSTVVRLVRTGAVLDAGDARLFVEAYLDRNPTVAELDAVLGALAMACQSAGRETRALFDERVARTYLAARGWAA
jgi:hypothetical protein